MTRKQVKIGVKVSFCDDPEEVGEIGGFDDFGIDIYYPEKSVLWNPLTISWLEIRNWKIVSILNTITNDTGR